MIIVYCINSFSPYGGIERVTVCKANALAQVKDNVVWIVYTDYSDLASSGLSPNVHCVNLNIGYYKDDWKSSWHVVKGVLFKRRVHKKKLIDTLHQINPDIVISVGHSEKHFLPLIKGPWKTIREYHSPKNYRVLFSHSLFDRISAIIADCLDKLITNQHYDIIVSLTNEDWEMNWHNDNRVVVIPNPIRFIERKQSSLTEKRAIAVGRLSSEKNYISLIRSFRYVVDHFPEWQLDIFGEGPEKQRLVREINRLSLMDNVHLRAQSQDIQNEMINSSMLVASSLYEGYCMVIAEAMSCGLPVVSYSFSCGPKDVIIEGENGFLVPVGDEEQMADRMCRLMANEPLRKQMGESAFNRSKLFSIERITKRWMALFESLCNKN